MSTLQPLHDIERARLHLLCIPNHALLLFQRYDAIELAHHIRGRDIFESRISLIAPQSAYAMRFQQRSLVLTLGDGDIMKERMQSGVFADGYCASLDDVNHPIHHLQIMIIRTSSLKLSPYDLIPSKSPLPGCASPSLNA